MINKPVEPVVTDFLFRRAVQCGSPLSGTFELTPLCNMRCKMCYVRLDPQQQAARGSLATAEQWLRLGKDAARQGMLYLLLTGGEPFSHPEIQKIMTGLHEMGLIVSVNTNGTLINEDVMQWLSKAAPSRVNVTLYGASDETYGRLCGNPNGFSQTVRAIELLRNAGISVKINCSVTPDNVRDLPKIHAFCREKGLVLHPTTYMFPPLRRDETQMGDNFRFSAEDAAFYSAYIQYLDLGKERFLALPVEQPLEMEQCAEIGDGVRCRAGRCSFWVTWDGKLLPCGMFTLSNAPNVFTDDFLCAWQQIRQDTEAIRLPARCSGCALQKHCRACAAMVFTESGCFDKIPLYRCEMAHSFAAQQQRLKNMILDGTIPKWMTEGSL